MTRRRDGFPYPSDIPYAPETWTPEQCAAHRADTLEGAFHAASCLSGGWYGRAVTIDYRADEAAESGEAYTIRPSEVAAPIGWAPCYEVRRAS